MKIELAKIEDIEYIHKLIYERCLWFLNKGLIGWGINYYPYKYNQEYFKEQMKSNKLYVVKKDNNICGAMLLKNEDSDVWDNNRNCYYIHHLVTDNKVKGIGKMLIDFAIEQCKKDGKEYLRLDCFKSSQFLNEYYKNIGFVNVGSGIQPNYEYNLYEMRVK